MKYISVALLTIAAILEVNSEAFFLGRGASSPSPSSTVYRKYSPRHQPYPRQHKSYPGNSPRSKPTKSYKKPAYPPKGVVGSTANYAGQSPVQNSVRPSYPQKKPHRGRPQKYPAAPAIKLDYGGWKAIGFDDSLPVKAPSSQPTSYSASDSSPNTYSAPAPVSNSYSAQSPSSGSYSAPPPSFNSFSAPSPSSNTYSAPAASSNSYSAPVAPTYSSSAPVSNYNSFTSQTPSSYAQPTYSAPPQKTYTAPSPALSPAPTYPKPFKSLDPDIVTIEDAFNNAPPAQSEETPTRVYNQPPPEPITIALPQQSGPVKVPSTYGAPVPAVPYIPSTLDIVTTYQQSVPSPPSPAQYTSSPRTQYNKAPTPQYKSAPQKPNSPVISRYNSPKPLTKYVPSAKPEYGQPSTTVAPAPPPKPKLSYLPPPSGPPPTTRRPQLSGLYGPPPATTTSSPVVLPPFTPSPDDVELEAVYNPKAFGSQDFPIVSLIPEESQNIPVEEELFLTYNSVETPSSGQYENAAEAGSLTSGAVFVQQKQIPAPVGNTDTLNDELYYIYYQDPQQDPGYGLKVQREAVAEAAPLQEVPIYDYDESLQLVDDSVRNERDESAIPEYTADLNEQEEEEEELEILKEIEPVVHRFRNYRNIGGSSSVSFNQEVGGKTSRFSYNL